jgi:hypothetical protein
MNIIYMAFITFCAAIHLYIIRNYFIPKVETNFLTVLLQFALVFAQGLLILRNKF